MRTRPLVKYQSPAILWGLFIMLILLLPVNEIDNTNLLGFIETDKVIHFALFMFLGLLNRVGWAKFFFRDSYPFKANWFTLFFCLVFAFLTELTQMLFTDYRFFSFYDIVADVIGVFFGIFLYYVIYKS